MAIDLETLRRKMLFLGLSDAQLQALSNTLSQKILRAGEVLLRQGDEADSLFLVQQGCVEMILEKAEAGQDTLVFKPGSFVDENFVGDFFGEFTLLDLARWPGTVVAKDRSVLLVFEREQLYDLFARDIDLQIGLVLNIARVLSRRLRNRNRQLTRFKSYKNPSEL